MLRAAELERLGVAVVGVDAELRTTLWSRGMAAATAAERPATFRGLPFRAPRDREAAVREVRRVLRHGAPRPFWLRLSRGLRPLTLEAECVRADGGVVVFARARVQVPSTCPFVECETRCPLLALRVGLGLQFLDGRDGTRHGTTLIKHKLAIDPSAFAFRRP